VEKQASSGARKGGVLLDPTGGGNENIRKRSLRWAGKKVTLKKVGQMKNRKKTFNELGLFHLGQHWEPETTALGIPSGVVPVITFFENLCELKVGEKREMFPRRAHLGGEKRIPRRRGEPMERDVWGVRVVKGRGRLGE